MSFLYLFSAAMSRLYMGVHSFIDVAGGGLIGAVIMIFLHFYGDPIDNILYKSNYGIFVTFGLIAIFIMFYPKARPWTASFG